MPEVAHVAELLQAAALGHVVDDGDRVGQQHHLAARGAMALGEVDQVDDVEVEVDEDVEAAQVQGLGAAEGEGLGWRERDLELLGQRQVVDVLALQERHLPPAAEVG